MNAPYLPQLWTQLYKKLAIVVFLLSIIKSNAQTYVFTQTTGTYAPLTNPISINGSAVWSSFQSFTVPIGFGFNFMGNSYNTIYIEGSGFCRFDANYYYLINPFTTQLKDKGTNTSLSPLSYRLEGNIPNRILKIEWNNCGFVNDANGTANFQLWLYETSNIIEFRTGLCNATSQGYSGNANPGPAMGIYKFSSANFCVYGVGLLGNPASATATTISNANTSIFTYSLNSTPASGNIYRFTPQTSSVFDIVSSNKFLIYPNPNDGNMTLEYEINDDAELQITDITGKIICAYKLSSANNVITINCNELSDGVYLYKILASGNIIKSDKIIVIK